MKSLTFSCRIFVLLALLAAPAAFAGEPEVVSSGDLFLPSPAERLECAQCIQGFTSSPGGGAASHWGLGTSCTNATNDLRNQLFSYAASYCVGQGYQSTCDTNVVYTANCYWHSGYLKYVRDGYINFGCYTWGIDCQN